jgi:hypothetical protein
MTRFSKVNCSRRHATSEQTAGINCDRVVEFAWSNEEWARIRLASALVAHDDDELLAVFQELIPEGVVPDMLEGLALTRGHVETLHALLSATLMRSFAVLERCGYGPDNETSETAVT